MGNTEIYWTGNIFQVLILYSTYYAGGGNKGWNPNHEKTYMQYSSPVWTQANTNSNLGQYSVR
jgi:hypothetical protein